MQIIERRLKQSIENLNNDYDQVQYGYNSDGHLVIRFYNKLDKKQSNEDLLIVFAAAEYNRLKGFINKIH